MTIFYHKDLVYQIKICNPSVEIKLCSVKRFQPTELSELLTFYFQCFPWQIKNRMFEFYRSSSLWLMVVMIIIHVLVEKKNSARDGKSKFTQNIDEENVSKDADVTKAKTVLVQS